MMILKCNINIFEDNVHHKDALRRRYLPMDKQWFHWQALKNYDFLAQHLNRRRIYVSTMDRWPYNRFAIGESGIWPGRDILFIQPYEDRDLLPLTTYLNSKAFRESYILLGYKRGGRLLFTQRLLKKSRCLLIGVMKTVPHNYKTRYKNTIFDPFLYLLI